LKTLTFILSRYGGGINVSDEDKLIGLSTTLSALLLAFLWARYSGRKRRWQNGFNHFCICTPPSFIL